MALPGIPSLLVVLLLVHAASVSDSCTLSSQLDTALPWFGGKLIPVPPNCSVLGLDQTAPTIVSSSLTLRGDASGAGSLDAQYAVGALLVTSPGVQLVIDTLHLYNVRMDSSPFLTLSAFNASKLRMSSVDIRTDCLTLSTLAEPASGGTFIRGPGFLYVARYVSADVNATNVNITCNMPSIQHNADGDAVTVADSEELFNAMFGDANSTAPLTVITTTNLTLSTDLWHQSRALSLTRNVTLQGDPGVLNVLDLNCMAAIVDVAPGVFFGLTNFWILNAGPLRGKLRQLGLLPLFSLPVWFFTFARVPNAPQLLMTNVTISIPPSEYSYFMLWTVIMTTEVPIISEATKQLRASTSIIKLGVAPNRDTIAFAHLRGAGSDMYNTSLTAALPAGPFVSYVLDNPNLQFSFEAAPNLTHLPVYTFADVKAVVEAMQESQPTVGVALFLMHNITFDASAWPADGYNISVPLLFVGLSSLGTTHWIDFRRVPRLVRAFGCAPSMYVYVQGLSLINLPNAMQLPAGSRSGAAPLGSADAAGMDDVSIYLSNILAANRTCTLPLTFINQTAVVVTYAEYKRVYAAVAKSFGTTRDGVGSAIGSNFTYTLLNVVLSNIRFSTVVGWGWSGFRSNITYVVPDGAPTLYNNRYDPPSPPQAPGLVVITAPTSHKDELLGWQVAIIVLGAVAFVAGVTGLVAWRIVSRLKKEVDAVKSGSSDRRQSSAPSADCEGGGGNGVGGSGGAVGRLNSSGNGNGGDLTPGSPAMLKGGLGGGENGGDGGGGALSGASGGKVGSNGDAASQVDKPPLEVLNSMMATLTREMNDQHLTILEVIGQGGFGVVYKGLWKGLNVAVKTITFQDRVAGGEKAQHRAILEAAISSSLAHPNVVTTYSYDIKALTVQDTGSIETPSTGGTGGTVGTGCSAPGGGSLKIIDRRTVLDWKLYLIQEYCDGGSLRTAILKRKFFDMKRGEPRMEMLLDTALELAGGLVHLHERNIIHGDLNPNNVLLKRDPSRKYGAICKIADFGLSIKMGADQSHISNMRRGTPFYTCPQILSRGNMTKAADVYSMGVMMWEMYHCCMSYRSLPNGFVARENFPAFPRRAPHDFAQLVAACLDPEPAARPSFPQMRAALEAQLAALKRGELRSGELVLGPDHPGDAAHMAACQD